MNERYRECRTERIARFEEENICNEKKVDILTKYIRVLMNKMDILCNKFQTGEILPNGGDDIIEEMNIITYKLQVVIELQKDYKQLTE